MKKALITALIMLPLAAFAGDKDHHHSGSKYSGPRMENIIEKLELTEDQSSQVEQIFKAHREKMKLLREDTETKVNAILNAEQRKKLDKMKAKRHEKRDERKEDRKEKRKEKQDEE